VKWKSQERVKEDEREDEREVTRRKERRRGRTEKNCTYLLTHGNW
jgi:hypothetical protein